MTCFAKSSRSVAVGTFIALELGPPALPILPTTCPMKSVNPTFSAIAGHGGGGAGGADGGSDCVSPLVVPLPGPVDD
jgi:hypothetical protein